MLRNSESVETTLQRIAEKARKEPRCVFTSLFHLMNEELWEAEGRCRLGHRQRRVRQEP